MNSSNNTSVTNFIQEQVAIVAERERNDPDVEAIRK